jgi:hypothetical protein
MNQDKIVEKLNAIFNSSLELKKLVAGNPALEGDIDRILAISKDKLLLLDPENFIMYQKGLG